MNIVLTTVRIAAQATLGALAAEGSFSLGRKLINEYHARKRQRLINQAKTPFGKIVQKKIRDRELTLLERAVGFK